MKALKLAVATLVAPTALAAADDASPRKFTAERVFDVEYAGDPQISPDGRTVVYARRWADIMTDRFVSDIWAVDADGGSHRPLITGEGSISSPRWSPSGDRLLYVGRRGEATQLRVRYMDSGESFSLAQLPEGPSAPVWSPDGRMIAFTMFTPGETPSFAKAPKAPKGATWNDPLRVWDDIRIRQDGQGWLREGANHVYVVPAEGGTPRQVTKGENDFGSPEWLDNDTLLVVGNDVEDADLDPIESEIYALELSDLSMRALTSRDGPDNTPRVSPDGRQIAYLGYDDKLKAYQKTDLYIMNRDGTGARNVTASYGRSIDDIAWRGGDIVAQVEVDGDVHLVSISTQGRASTLARDLGGAAIGRPYAGGSFSVGGGVIAYTASKTAERPGDVAVLRGGSARVLTALNDDLFPHLDIAKIEEIKIKSSFDGREVEGWVALPPGFKADGSYPMILEIHGGPYSMYGPFFSADIQRYAAEGYVAIYTNPRGSTGYGEEFAQLIDLNYPGQDYNDLMDFVDALIAKNYVDPERLFVTGGSGGGVLTAWIVGNTDRFAAAVAMKPVINWVSEALSADIGALVVRHWIRALPWEDLEAYWKFSPLSLVGKVETPTMVMVGEEDWRTPAWEAEQYYTALKLRKIPTALVRIPSSPHNISGRPSRIIAQTDTVMGWFAKFDPAKQSGSETAGE